MSIPAILSAAPADLLHPAFDVRDNVMTLGFSVKKSDGKGTVRLQVVSDGREVSVCEVSPDATQVSVFSKKLAYQAPPGVLPFLDDHWNRDDLVKLLADPSSLPGPELYRRLVAGCQQHLEFDHRGKYVILVCWTAMTYVYPLFSSVPFLHLLGPKGTGKSQSLDVLAQLARLGYKSQQTAPSIGDMIQLWRITPLLDQADFLTPQHVDLLADSYRAGARRSVTNMDDRSQPHVFETFGPKAFGGTSSLNQDLADRVILINTTPATRNLEPVVPGDPELSRLRYECYRWALLNFWKVPGLIEMMLQVGESSILSAEYSSLKLYRGRQHDLWLPIEVMMEALGVPDEDRQAARDYYARSQVATKAELRDEQIELVQLLRGLVGTEASVAITSTNLLHQLSDDEDEGGKPLWTPLKLGLALKGLNVLKSKERTTTRNERLYVIDGEAVRSLSERFGVFPNWGDTL